MCTMTWFLTDGGYELFFNRDERITRRRASGPTLQVHNQELGGLNYVSPTDADAGGTWIASNELGITVCLLNHYQFQQISTYKNWISRGEIVREFSSYSNLGQAQQRFKTMNLDDYRAFRMFLIEPSGRNLLLIWDGHLARIEKDVTTPKSSSSVDAKHVKSMRKKLFDDLNLIDSTSSQDFINYHTSHLPSKSKESVCMHREDAQTVSLCHVVVNPKEVSYHYADGSPCEVELTAAASMPLVVQGSLKKAVSL